MPNRVQNKRSSTQNNPPTAGQLEAGEIALNTHQDSANIHFEDAAGSVRSVGADPSDLGDYVRRVGSDGAVGEWVSVSNVIPGADDDFGYWSRNASDDELTPRYGADNIVTTANMQAGNFVIDQTTADVTVAAADPAAARTYTFPDVGGDRTITLDPDTPVATTDYVRRVTDAGVITWEENTGGGGGGASVELSETAPNNPSEGDLWWADTTADDGGGRLYIWTGDEWVDTSLPTGGGGGSADLSNYVTLDSTQTITGQKTFSQSVIADISGNAATANSATSATTATNANKIKRNGKTKTDTGSYRLLLGANSNTAGYGDCYVITDRTSCYYTPSTDQLTVGTVNANLNSSKVGSAYKLVAWNGIGMICMTSSSYQPLLAPGSNQSGSSIIPACASGAKYGNSGLPGTWRCQGMQVQSTGTFSEQQTTNHIRTA